ncbi:cell division protein FtsI (penicillin-binding protein 3) [Kutzneria viridogrisea]|uniref:Cell division protein FtsI (Penicillin-binding protein 3) n=1 Tax=Kutzneria viridogrisea TaxID=47990 RepID=A0ABR6BNT4_9PSEU|nr:penicillin-binding transpeptidase domain-containing protein [Kutzneria albida]MBA8928559.1 cell division protein FtsI (penicillin-binding protein 3) [Kutzneria viridogrisea]
MTEAQRVAARVGLAPRIARSRLLLVFVLVVVAARLVQVQVVDAATLSQAAQKQRATPMTVFAQRGQITDRDGHPLAYTREARTLSMNPRQLRADWQADPEGLAALGLGRTYEEYTQRLADYVHQMVGGEGLLGAVRAELGYQVLAETADPGSAILIAKRYPVVRAEPRLERVYPNGRLAAGVVGTAIWQSGAMHGLSGIETAWDNQLRGSDGKRVVDTASGSDSLELPGTDRDDKVAVPGSGLRLTLDTDVQFQAEQAAAAGVVVLDARSAEVYALTGGLTAIEPGPVLGVVPTAGAVEYGTVTSDRMAELVDHFGAGQHTGIGLPGEQAGAVLPREQWSAATAGQVARGSGLTTTLVQLAGMYQAIANDGIRVPPRVVAAETTPDGSAVAQPRPDGVRAVSPDTARATRDQLRLPVLTGFSVSGLAGACGAGRHCGVAVLPADHPRFVLAVQSEGDPIAVLHQLAGYLVERFGIPMT